MTVLGAVFLPSVPPERLRPAVRAADESGLEQLWLWEDCFKESGVASAAAALAWSSRVTIAVGLLPVPLRNVGLTAMEVATLNRLFPDRVTIGIGHGVQSWMGQVGARVGSPVTLLREYLSALRALLHGDTVSTDGRYVRLADVALDWPPASPVPVLVGAVGDRTLRLAGEAADGTILTSSTSVDQVRRARRAIDEAATAAGRAGPHPLTVYLAAATGPGAADRLAADKRAAGHAPDAPFGAAGDAATIAAAVRRYADAGADTVVLEPTSDDTDPETFIRFVTHEVRPLVP